MAEDLDSLDLNSREALTVRHLLLSVILQTSLSEATLENLAALASVTGSLAEEMGISNEKLVRCLDFGREARKEGAKIAEKAKSQPEFILKMFLPGKMSH